MSGEQCRTPGKIKHTRPSAEKHLQALLETGASVDLHVYPCDGHWHVGHSQVSLRKRIRNALHGR